MSVKARLEDDGNVVVIEVRCSRVVAQGWAYNLATSQEERNRFWIEKIHPNLSQARRHEIEGAGRGLNATTMEGSIVQALKTVDIMPDSDAQLASWMADPGWVGGE